MAGGIYPPCLSQTHPAGFPLVRAARWRILLLDVCFFVGSPECSSSRYITGALLIAISMPFVDCFVFNEMRKETGWFGL
jgi:hypothetical protein